MQLSCAKSFLFRVPRAVTTILCLGLCHEGFAEDFPQATIGEPADPVTWTIFDQPRRGEGQDSWIRADHPPVDEIPQGKMPHPRSEPHSDSEKIPAGDLLVHDSEKNLTVRHGMPSLENRGNAVQGGGFNGIDNLISKLDSGQRGFGIKTLVSESRLTSYPQRAQVKVLLRFENNSGADAFAQCSGTMLDSGVVLTAGHCVYNSDPEINDWAKEAWIYPGWDGDGQLRPGVNESRQYWGWARGTQFAAFERWVEKERFNGDVGLIRLRRTDFGNRQVGMLTGWLGWAFGQTCSTIKSRTYYNFSYPAEDCPTAGLHNGRDMYFWSGSIDSCNISGRQLAIDTGTTCMNAMWGGESGSSIWYTDGGRYAHAVASNSDRSSLGRYTKLWQEFIDYFRNTFRPNSRTDSPDWELLRFRTERTKLQPGESPGTATVEVANATDADPPFEVMTIDLYLSENNNVTSSDYRIGQVNYTEDFRAMEMKTFNVPDVMIISDGFPPGTYWLGGVLTVDGDTYSANNNVWGWDAQRIEIVDENIFDDRFEN